MVYIYTSTGRVKYDRIWFKEDTYFFIYMNVTELPISLQIRFLPEF